MHGAEAIAALAFFGIMLPVVIVTFGAIVKRMIDYKERKLSLTADRTAEKAAQYASHVEKLEARVRVLERIATDKGADLAQQIEELRVEPVVAGAKEKVQ